MNPDVQIIAFPHLYGYMPCYDVPDNTTADLFGYVFAEVLNLAAAGGTTQNQIIIQDDSDFELRRLVYHFTLADAAYVNAAYPVPNMTIQLTDTGAGRNLFNNAVPLDCIASPSYGAARDLPWPKILRRNSTIQATYVNFDAAVATGHLRLVMFGRKLFS